MKINVSEATPLQLDFLVAKARDEIGKWYCTRHGVTEVAKRFHPSTNWSQGGPIIEQEIANGMNLYGDGSLCGALYYDVDAEDTKRSYHGPTPLIAAMRCYIASKLGDEVEIPDELV